MPDISKNHPLKELDNTYTPLEKIRREKMKLHDLKYGCYYFTGHAIEDPRCCKCNRKQLGHYTSINSRIYCDPCLSGK